MKTITTAALAACFFLTLNAARGTTIELDLGATRTTESISFQFEELNGIPLLGQTLSIDFVFANDGFVRVFGRSFIIALTMQTNNTGIPQFDFREGTGYVFDNAGQALTPPTVFQSGGVGFVPPATGLLEVGLGLGPPLLFYGFHFDIKLPNEPSFEIGPGFFGRGSTLGLADFQHGFGIGPHVPDSMSTLWLIVPTVALLLFDLRRRRARFAHRTRV
jgi:hypothetical protein